MEQLLQFISAFLTSNSGQVTYQALYDATTPELRPLLPRAINALRADGVLKRNLVWDAQAKANTLYIQSVG